jgi:hypothetical protein
MRGNVVNQTLDDFAEMTPWLWWLSVMFYGIGDLITTGATALAIPVAEGGPLTRWVLETGGLTGLGLLKVCVLGFSYLFWRLVGHPHNVGIPVALSVIGIGFTTWNLFVLSSI